MNDRTAYTASFVCLLAGAVAGAGLALLVAPQAGTATRAMMRRRLRDAADSARRMQDRVVRQGHDIGDETAHRLTGAAAALAGHGSHDERGRDDGAASA